MRSRADAMLDPELSSRRAGVGRQYREWAQARFFCVRSDLMSPLQNEIERRLAHAEPDIEVLLAEVVGGRCLRAFIDPPDGVTLAISEHGTMLLNDLRERYSLEVSSPGSDRPLTKPAHYRRFLGRRARVRTRHPRPALHDPRRAGGAAAEATARSFTGELVGASEEEVTLAADGG